MKKSRVLAGLLALVMLTTTLAACQQEKSGSSGDSGNKSNAGTSETAAGGSGEEKEIVELEVFTFWGAAADVYPDNAVGKALEEKTGVRLIPAGLTGGADYIQKMNLMFAAGDTPDICQAPYWGGTDISTITIKKAAKEGLLLPLDDLVAEYGPHLQLTERMADDFLQVDLEDPGFNGNHYVLPHHYYTDEDVSLWMYGTFARQDVLDEIGVKPEEITSSEKIYEVCKLIKEKGIQDFNGNPIIPAGAFNDGWAHEMYPMSYKKLELGNLTKLDGKFTLNFFDPLTDDYTLFLRKMVSEGLLDPECFQQTRETADQKIKNGSYAFLPAHYQGVYEAYEKYLKADHPESVYVPIGPVLNADGKPIAGYGRQQNGTAGAGVLFLPKGCSNPEAAIRVLDYLNTEEGARLSFYGIEGKDYTMVDGQPRATKELLELNSTNPEEMGRQGIRRLYSELVVNDMRVSAFGEANIGEADAANDPGSKQKYELYDKFMDMYDYEFLDGFKVEYLGFEYPEIDRINTLNQLGSDTILQAAFASSDEEALKMLNDTRKQMMDNGMQDYLDFINEKAAARDDIIY